MKRLIGFLLTFASVVSASSTHAADIKQNYLNLFRIGCLESSRPKNTKKYLDALRCFQKHIGVEPNGVITKVQEMLLERRALAGDRVEPQNRPKTAPAKKSDVPSGEQPQTALKAWGCIEGDFDTASELQKRNAIRCWRRRAYSSGTGDLTAGELRRMNTMRVPISASGEWDFRGIGRSASVGFPKGKRNWLISCSEAGVSILVPSHQARPKEKGTIKIGGITLNGKTSDNQLTRSPPLITLDNNRKYVIDKLIEGAETNGTLVARLWQTSTWVTTRGLATALGELRATCIDLPKDPIAVAVEAGPTGLPPDFSGDDEAVSLKREVWEKYGLQLRKSEKKVYIASLQFEGPAQSQGLHVGDEIEGVEGLFVRNGSVERIHRYLTGENPDDYPIRIYVWKFDGSSKREYKVFASNSASFVKLPSALRQVTRYEGLIGIYKNDFSGLSTNMAKSAAMLILQEISTSSPECFKDETLEIGVQISRTTNSVNGFGVVRGSSTDVFQESLTVPAILASWVRGNISLYSTAVNQKFRSAVRDLVKTDGCSGVHTTRLLRGVYLVAGVAQ